MPSSVYTDNTLYFGCRSASKDQHYASEWRTYSNEGDLVYRLAPSRDGPEGSRRTYVQDLMIQDSKRIWEAIDRKAACVYISGYVALFSFRWPFFYGYGHNLICSDTNLGTVVRSSNKMPAAVRRAIMSAVREEGGKTEEEASAYVVRLERAGRLIEESWS
jgi:sulfite reductase alpha subunit-like flavoprotein